MTILFCMAPNVTVLLRATDKFLFGKYTQANLTCDRKNADSWHSAAFKPRYRLYPEHYAVCNGWARIIIS